MSTTTLTGAVHVEKSATISRPPEDVYGFWRNFENLPLFMRNIESVKVLGPRRSHWTLRAPLHVRIEWDAEIINEKENELIAWQSLEGADVPNAGSVRFLPLDWGQATEVKVVLNYERVVGGLGSAIARLFGDSPAEQLQLDLHRLQQVLETGEVATVEDQPRGTCR